MVQGEIEQDQAFRHIRTGGEYIVTSGTACDGEKVDTKLKVMGVWVPCIVYYSPYLPNMVYVRPETEFREKFERIE